MRVCRWCRRLGSSVLTALSQCRTLSDGFRVTRRDRAAFARGTSSRRRISIWIASDDRTSDDLVCRRRYAPRSPAVVLGQLGSSCYRRWLHLGQTGARALVYPVRKLTARRHRPHAGAVPPGESLNRHNCHAVMQLGRSNHKSAVVRSWPSVWRSPVSTIISSPMVRSAPALPRSERIPSDLVATRSWTIEETNKRGAPVIIPIAVPAITRAEARYPGPSESRQV